LVDQIEAGGITSPETRAILVRALESMLAERVDEIVMGCTHYPFVIPLIQEIVGDDVEVIDPAPAVARQAGRLLDEYDLKKDDSEEGKVFFYTSGKTERFDRILKTLLGIETCSVGLDWVEGDLQAR